MTKEDTASYCVSLLTIMDSKMRAGREVGSTLVAEYEKAYASLIELIKKENENETRESEPRGPWR